MGNYTRTVLILVGVVTLLLISLLATRVGGIAIRNTFNGGQLLVTLSSEPQLLGVPLSVNWTGATPAMGQLTIQVRYADQQQLLATVPATAGQARLTLPCTVVNPASLVFIAATGQVVAQVPLAVAPAGEDCFLAGP